VLRTRPESLSLVPEYVDALPKIVKVRSNDVLFVKEDRASCPNFECNFDLVVERRLNWDCQQTRSIAAHVVGPLDPEGGEE
jgi:hypothetical protein